MPGLSARQPAHHLLMGPLLASRLASAGTDPALSSAISEGQFVNFTMGLAFLSRRWCVRSAARSDSLLRRLASLSGIAKRSTAACVTISTAGKATPDSRRSQSAEGCPTRPSRALNRPAARIEFP